MTTDRHDCVRESDLLRHIDGELDGVDRRRVDAHLAICVPCADRRLELARDAEEVRVWLSAHDAEPPPAHAYTLPLPSIARQRWVVAAGILLVLGVVAGPARAWVSDWMAGEALPTEARVAVEAPSHASTAFVPTSRDVTLRFTRAPAAGSLRIRRSGDSLVRLRERTPEESELVLEANGIEVVPSHGTLDFELELPASVERLVVDRGEGTPDVLTFPEGPIDRVLTFRDS